MAGFETVSVLFGAGDARGMPRDGCDVSDGMVLGKPCVHTARFRA